MMLRVPLPPSCCVVCCDSQFCLLLQLLFVWTSHKPGCYDCWGYRLWNCFGSIVKKKCILLSLSSLIVKICPSNTVSPSSVSRVQQKMEAWQIAAKWGRCFVWPQCYDPGRLWNRNQGWPKTRVVCTLFIRSLPSCGNGLLTVPKVKHKINDGHFISSISSRTSTFSV